MSGGIEAAGDALTGAVIARAVEPTHGREAIGQDAVGQDGQTHESACLNCGTPLMGSHCHACGQVAHLHRSLSALWHDLAHGAFHFEGKVWSTLPLLAWRPGDLTRRYIHGERAKFVSPIALFLFSVFLMFAVISATAGSFAVPDSGLAKGREQAVSEMNAQLADMEKRGATLRAQRRAATGDVRRTLDGQIATLNREMAETRSVRALFGANGPDGRFTDLKTGWSRLDKGIEKANANPNLALYKVQTSAYKYSWALIPISVPFVWLMFAWRRKYRMYDHAVFVTYSLSFMTLLVVVLTILASIGPPEGVIESAITFVPPVHMYRQLRGAYGIGRASAALRTIALLAFAQAALSIFFLLLLGLGMLG